MQTKESKINRSRVCRERLGLAACRCQTSDGAAARCQMGLSVLRGAWHGMVNEVLRLCRCVVEENRRRPTDRRPELGGLKAAKIFRTRRGTLPAGKAMHEATPGPTSSFPSSINIQSQVQQPIIMQIPSFHLNWPPS